MHNGAQTPGSVRFYQQLIHGLDAKNRISSKCQSRLLLLLLHLLLQGRCLPARRALSSPTRSVVISAHSPRGWSCTSRAISPADHRKQIPVDRFNLRASPRTFFGYICGSGFIRECTLRACSLSSSVFQTHPSLQCDAPAATRGSRGAHIWSSMSAVGTSAFKGPDV